MRIDNHCHIFSSGGITPPPAPMGAAYSSPTVGVPEYWEHMAELGCTHGVIVQPSSYGTDDHAILLDVLRHDTEHLRGVACARPDIPDAALATMAGAGVVGTRVQDGYPGGVPVEQIAAVADRVKPLGWHIEVWSDLRQHLSWLGDTIADLGVDVVIDHLGNMPSDVTLESAEMQQVLQIMALENVWVTLSGSERLVPGGPDIDDAQALDRHDKEITARVQAFVDTAPDRVMWGSDWPHVALGNPPTSGQLLTRFERWVPDAALREKIVTVNNARRYGF